jgi:hypothetical protein
MARHQPATPSPHLLAWHFIPFPAFNFFPLSKAEMTKAETSFSFPYFCFLLSAFNFRFQLFPAASW